MVVLRIRAILFWSNMRAQRLLEYHFEAPTVLLSMLGKLDVKHPKAHMKEQPFVRMSRAVRVTHALVLHLTHHAILVR